MVQLKDITIRLQLQPGDIGYITFLHGKLYAEEYGYSINFESYVASGLHEFWTKFTPDRNRVWVCEHQSRIIGFMLLIDRGEWAQLRFFLIEQGYRNIGLDNKLMELFMKFMKECGYRKAYLLTTHELPAAAHLYKKYGFRLTEEKADTSFGKAVYQQRYDLLLS